ncbi:carbohydrate-binding protein [Lentzea tibetensis]|uniref:Carbohydrate-binding protein n=1 Tax=Lentzea tibetensis TaxID=2591470 RepID=A0A563EXT2_9PSEU|nr:glycoside hydrolase family 88 protein [Lentzea tibetensis]TWP51944.1 carbohydrate-binding protein [Lentzea tibetensis]
MVARGSALRSSVLLISLVAAMMTAPPAQAAETRFEAENAVLSRGVVESNHAGFTGTGFVNYDNASGSYVEFTITNDTAQAVPLSFRYANGTTTNRPLDVAVNGTSAGTINFAGTGAWTSWRAQTISVQLPQGTSKIRASATTSNGGPNLDSLTVGATTGTDWSVAVVESTMAQYTPAQLGGWSYTRGLYLYGQYLVYQRTKDPRYLSYIKAWVDRFVDSGGNMTQNFNNLDSMLSGRLLNILYKETGQAKYQTAAKKIRNRLNTYPRTSDGGFWHSTSESRHNQLWADGVFMLNPFLAEYGKTFNDSAYANEEALKQLNVYASHLQQPSGILKHAYDEAKDESWANPQSGLAPEYWCRAIGWYAMATIDILEVVPANHPRRAQTLTDFRELVVGIQRYQDAATGRWWQVVDKGGQSGNWLETSCSMMFSFALSRGVERGYLDPSYKAVAAKGYQGVLQKTSIGSNGRTQVSDISIGTNVGDYGYYIARERATNDFHGLGAFLIMSEQFTRVGV